MDGRPTWTDCDEAGDYVVPNVLSPRDLISRPDSMDETVVPHKLVSISRYCIKRFGLGAYFFSKIVWATIFIIYPSPKVLVIFQ